MLAYRGMFPEGVMPLAADARALVPTRPVARIAQDLLAAGLHSDDPASAVQDACGALRVLCLSAATPKRRSAPRAPENAGISASGLRAPEDSETSTARSDLRRALDASGWVRSATLLTAPAGPLLSGQLQSWQSERDAWERQVVIEQRWSHVACRLLEIGVPAQGALWATLAAPGTFMAGERELRSLLQAAAGDDPSKLAIPEDPDRAKAVQSFMAAWFFCVPRDHRECFPKEAYRTLARCPLDWFDSRGPWHVSTQRLFDAERMPSLSRRMLRALNQRANVAFSAGRPKRRPRCQPYRVARATEFATIPEEPAAESLRRLANLGASDDP